MSEQQQATATSDEQLVNHQPDELCVDVSAPDGSDPARLYEDVRGALNRYLDSEARRLTASTLQRDGFTARLAHDIEPSLLHNPDSEVLQPLARGGISSSSGQQPWLQAYPGLKPGEHSWHLYYQVGDRRVSFATADFRERQEHERRVRQLTNLLNLGAKKLLEGPTDAHWTLSGSQANWMSAAMPFSCGSPAALPRAETNPRGPGPFRFNDRLLSELNSTGKTERGKVIVAVLDSCPDPTSFDDHGNASLRALLDTLRLPRAGSTLALPPEYFVVGSDGAYDWQTCLPWWQERMPAADEPLAKFAMPDHGVFVSGIVRSLAPDVELHLIRVLNDFGMGDLLALEHVLRALPEALLKNAGANTRLIVNLSLGSAVPVPRQRYMNRWLPAAGASPDERSNQLLDLAHGGLKSAVAWLHRQGVLVVAAAGNDALREHLAGKLPPPRYPAFYEPVFAVAAADATGQPAVYSNRGDVAPLGNGITTFGGSVLKPPSRVQPPRSAKGVRDGREQAIVGLYSSPTLPGGEPNETGWAHWSGTSFAAPIVSGLAALLWQQDAAQGPDALMARLRACAVNVARATPAGLDLDGALDAPYLDVWQAPH